MSVIFFGDTGEYLGIRARELDNNAKLIDRSNCDTVLQSKSLPDVSYTSLGDLPKSQKLIYEILDLATEIIYAPPRNHEWSDGKSLNIFNPTDSMRGYTDTIMLDFSKIKGNVKGMDVSYYHHVQIDRLADQRKSDQQQLWIAGCSISHGSGVNDDQRYGQLLANKLNLPVSFLTYHGTSPEWAADQILRSDIRAGDLVVWGLTYEGRMPWFLSDTDKLIHITLGGLYNHFYRGKVEFDVPESTLLQVISSDTRIYKSITSVKQVANYCSKIKAKLLIFELLSSDSVTLFLSQLPEFAPLRYLKHNKKYIDLGSDNDHPGPQQHQYYADFCFQQMQTRGYI